MIAKDYYLAHLGVQQWQYRENKSDKLVYALLNQQADWLFILEKQEIDLDSALLQAILAAIGQTLQSISVAYYDDAGESLALPARYIVAMGQAAPLLQARRHLYTDAVIICGDSLARLAEDISAKRQLWQQLKPYRI
jgi:DNA polymerase III psi subunit